MLWLCRKKFRKFAETASFRPGAYAFYSKRIEIGERVIIRPGTVLGADAHADIAIEDDALIGMNVHLYANNHRFGDISIPIIQQNYSSAPIRVSKGCWVGANVTVLAGVTIGENAVVAAGAVVTKEVEPYTVVGSVPARVLKRL